jgi:Mg2+ and Co2+ transporter CorA
MSAPSQPLKARATISFIIIYQVTYSITDRFKKCIKKHRRKIKHVSEKLCNSGEKQNNFQLFLTALTHMT